LCTELLLKGSHISTTQ